jgi:predicted secreted protein
VAIHRRVLDHFRPAFHDAAWQAVSALGAFETPSQDAAEQRINSALGQGLAGVRDAFRRAQKAANMALDTATEYRKIQARCTDW